MAASHDLLQSVRGGHEHDVSAEMKKESLFGVIGSDNNLSPDLTTHVVHEHGEHLQLDADRAGLRGGGGVGMGVSGMVFVGLVLGCIEANFCK